jgi:hypothetical protein
MSQKSIFCIASSRDHAEKIVYRLKNNGFSNRDVSTLYPDVSTVEERNAAAAGKVSAMPGSSENADDALSWMFGIGPMTIPGVGPYIAAGPIIRALKRASGKSTISQSLIGMGIPETEAKRFEGKIKHGNVLISFHNEHPEEIARAGIILKGNGGQDIWATDESAS